MSLALISILSFTLSFLMSLLLIWSMQWHHKWTGDQPTGPQKIHADMTSRSGGVAMFFATVIVVMINFDNTMGFIIIISILPVWIGGLGEDFTGKFPAIVRLLLSLLAGGGFALLSGVTILSTELGIIDWLLQNYYFALLATTLAIAGTCHAMNMLDGLNGLASGVSIISFGTIALLSSLLGNDEMFQLSLLFMMAIIGFWVLNFPKGLLFGGDAGAYFQGAAMSMMIIYFVEMNQVISPFFGLSIVFIPLYELFRTMLRRSLSGSELMAPDNKHLHSLLYRYLCNRLQMSQITANPITTAVFLPVHLCLCLYAFFHHSETSMLLFGLIVFVVTYELIFLFLKQQLSQFVK